MTHLEGWAVLYALQKWSRYLEGREGTKIICDHKALLWLRHNRYSDTSGKLIRWMAYVDSFNATFEHRAGKQHGDADAMTRMYDGEDDITWDQEDNSMTWMFELLAKYIPPEIRQITEVNFNGPVGRKHFVNEKYQHHMCKPENNGYLNRKSVV